jgi:hypothetical protein
MGDAAEMAIEFDEGPAVLADMEEGTPEPSEQPVSTGDADTPTAREDDPDPKSQPEDHLQKKIAEQAYKRRVAEREAEQLRKRLEALEQQANQQARPEVPAIPDPLSLTDEQLRERMNVRDEAIRQAAAYDAHQAAIKQQRDSVEAERQQRQQEALYKAAETYSARAVQLGMKPEELQAAGNMVARFGIDAGLGEMILHDDQGPLITKYLANNLADLEQINAMTPMQAAVYIATKVKPKAASLKPRVSNAPEPTDSVRNSASALKNLGPGGATYE